jgi:hypothetical protein
MSRKAPKGSAARAVKPSGDVRPMTVPGLSLSVPTQWTEQTPSSSMRLAQIDVPGAGGGAPLVMFRFRGGGGGVEANVARWLGQISQPDGRPTSEVAKRTTTQVGALTVTSVDATGTFSASMGPSAPAGSPGAPPNAADSRLLAAVVEGHGDAYYIKLVGPRATIDPWAEAWTTMLGSLKAVPEP